MCRPWRAASAGVFARGLEVVAVLDQLDAERAHRRVLLDRVAARHDDGRGQAVARAAKPTDWPWLPRVALITPRQPARAGAARRSRSGRRAA
jgi:hypothetical protein